MFEIMQESAGNVIGVRMSGTTHKSDYAELTPKVEELAKQYDDIRILYDLSDFKSEAPDAWLADLKFSRGFSDKVAKMAIVGDKKWESGLAKVAAPRYAREARRFPVADMQAAWEWLKA